MSAASSERAPRVPRSTEALVVIAGAPESAVEGLMRNMGETISEINKLGDDAGVLFKRLLAHRAKLHGEHSIQVGGGLSPHMEAALKSFQDHDAAARRATRD